MNKTEIDRLLKLPFNELIAMADKTRQMRAGSRMDLCSIMNAKSGLCNQDCKFCAQSAMHSTGIDSYPLKSKEKIVREAIAAKDIGAERFGIVTSGDSLDQDELKTIADAVYEITDTVGIKVCASLGSLTEKDLRFLKNSGLSRYHHNIETSSNYFSKIATTHTFQDRIKTIQAVKSAGLELCSGGIIGMGEAMDDRVQMALALKDLDVDSVPINILVPIAGTAFENIPEMSRIEAIRTIAVFRIVLEDVTVKIAAGRESILKDFQAMAFMAGANGMLIGGYLTVRGRDVSEDWKLIKEVELLWRTDKNS